MQPSRSTSNDVAVEQASIELLLAAADRIGREATDEEAYYRDMLLTLVREGPFEAVAVWTISESGAVMKACAPGSASFSDIPESVVARALSNEAIEIHGDHSTNGTGHAPKARWIAGARIHGAEGIALEAAPRATANAERSQRLLEALAELISNVETRFRYLAARLRSTAAQDVERIVRSFHQGRSLNETALLIAGGFQESLSFDRCWVCQLRRGGARVIASSAPGDVARRQLLVRCVEDVAGRSLASGNLLTWSCGEATGPAGEAMLALTDEGKGRRIVVVPLTAPDSHTPAGVVVLEQFSGVVAPEEAARRQALVPHAALALDRAVETDRRRWTRRLLEADSHAWRKRAAALLIVAAAVLFLAMPIPFEVEAEGQLLPAKVRSVFAPADGVVEEIHVQHGQSVEADSPLLSIRSPELDLERERVAGQISELNAKLAAIQVMRTQGRPAASTEPAGDLSAQEEQIHVALKGAAEQRRLIEEQTARLALRSPIVGVVDRWDMNEALASRPVVRGQHLCDVLDVAGPWKLDLRIPDQSAALVFSAQAKEAALPIRFVVRTEPQTEYSTRLSKVGERTELNEAGQLYLRGNAEITSDVAVARRAGASVLARIQCGRRSRAFVWFHDLWDFVALQFL
jgi:biotin carboxyl carrier protein